MKGTCLFVLAIIYVTVFGAKCIQNTVHVSNYDQFAKALNEAKPGTFIALDPQGEYFLPYYSGTSTVVGKKNCPVIIASDPDKSDQGFATLQCGLYLLHSSYVIVRNVNFDASSNVLSVQHSKEVLIENATITGKENPDPHVGTATNLFNGASKTVVRNCIFNCSPSSVENASVTFEQCTFTSNGKIASSLSIEDSNNNIIRDCAFYSKTPNLVYLIFCYNSTNNVIKNNLFMRPSVGGKSFATKLVIILNNKDFLIKENFFVVENDDDTGAVIQDSEGTVCRSNKALGGGVLAKKPGSSKAVVLDDSC